VDGKKKKTKKKYSLDAHAVGCECGGYRFYFYLGLKHVCLFVYILYLYSPGITKLLTPLMQPALTYEDPFVLLPILAVATASKDISVKMVRNIICKGKGI